MDARNMYGGRSPTSGAPVALWAGTAGGLLSAFVKWGTEIPFPPRTVDRASPPAEMLHDIGLPVYQMTYVYSGHPIVWGPIAIHVVFSLVFAWAYCLGALRVPRITMAQGVFFGLALTVVFHGIVLPAGHWAPPIWNLSFDELASETFGHVLWAWTIEIVRRQILTIRFASGPAPQSVWGRLGART